MIFSPPFEGGVAGTVNYLISKNLISRPGWLIYSFVLFKYLCKTKTTSAEKALNHSDHFSGTGPLRLRQPINHPGRKQNLQHPDHNCTAATPPSKGGETFSISLATNQLLRLTAMGGKCDLSLTPILSLISRDPITVPQFPDIFVS
jgi:hypothetical protein